MSRSAKLSRLSAIAVVALSLGLTSCSSGSKSPPPTSVTGTVSSGGSALDEFVALLFTPSSGGAAVDTNTDASGAYTVDLTADTYSVTADRPGYEDFSATALSVPAEKTTTFDIDLTALAANTYITSANCATCHSAIYDTFKQTGHPFKLNKIVGGVAPTYPFTALPTDILARIGDDDVGEMPIMPGTDNTLGTPTTWNAVSYVIGGFNWKARFCDANGFIVTGTEVQYNYATDAMVAYHNNETDRPFSCGNCHTTGWKHFDATVSPLRQGNLPGMDGTFAEQGIGCESCHGAGSTHAQTKLAADITKTATPRTTADFMDGSFAYGKPVACGECHTRDGERDYSTDPTKLFTSAFDRARMAMSMQALPEGGRIAASSGLVKHHEQYDEILGIDPTTLNSTRSNGFMMTHGNCMNCHDPHKASVHRGNPAVTQRGVDDSNANCLSCHDANKFDTVNNLRGSMTTLKCVDCHMPKMAKSAVKYTLANGQLKGDVSSHLFTINLTGAPQFDGSFANPFITGDFACKTCHTGGTGVGEAFMLAGNMIPAGFDYHPN